MLVGQAGISTEIVRELHRALTAYELIKVRIADADRHTRATLGDELADGTGATIVDRVGKVLILWRARNDET